MEVVIDCCVLLAALSPPHHVEALDFVTDVLQKSHVIVVDTQGHIQEEYRRYCGRGSVLYDSVVAKLLTTPRKRRQVDGRPNAAWTRRLNTLSCHSPDRPYIAVAARSADRRLVSDDGKSILRSDIRQYIESALDVKVYGLAEVSQVLQA